MATAYSTLRQEFCERIGDWLSGTASGGDKTECQDVGLASLQEEPTAGMWFLQTSGTDSGSIRKIIKYQGADIGTPRVIWDVKMTTGVASTNSYELHKYHPNTLLDAINAARMAIFPDIYNPIEDETLTSHEHVQTYTLPTSLKDGPYEVFLGQWADIDTSDNLLLNDEFDSWTGSQPDSWTTPTYLTLTQETDFVENENLVRFISDGSNADTFTQSLSSPTNYAGQRLTLTIVVYVETASRVRAYLYDGTTATYSDYASAAGWQELSVSANMASAPSEVTAGMADAAGTAITGYVRQATLSASRERTGRAYYPLRDWDIRNGGTAIHFPYYLPDNRPILVRGKGHLTAVTTDASTMEIGGPQTEALYAEAAYYLFREMAMRRPSDNDTYLQNMAIWRAEADRLKVRYAMPFLPYYNVSPDWGS